MKWNLFHLAIKKAILPNSATNWNIRLSKMPKVLPKFKYRARFNSRKSLGPGQSSPAILRSPKDLVITLEKPNQL